MLAPLPSVEAYRRDAVSIEDGAGLDDAITAAWLESATRLERAAMTRGSERERLLSGLLAQQEGDVGTRLMQAGAPVTADGAGAEN